MFIAAMMVSKRIIAKYIYMYTRTVRMVVRYGPVLPCIALWKPYALCLRYVALCPQCESAFMEDSNWASK